MPLYILALIIVCLGGCASKPEHQPGAFEAPIHRGLSENATVERPFLVDDPWEGFNQRMYHFNAQFDRYVYLPVVHVYEEILPDSVQNGISNVFNNLKEIPIFFNSVLQGKAKKASVSLGRFIFNTTIGLGGIIDVLATGGIHQENEDFGQTLGFWGLSTGPYLVLPILGPSNVRDTAGMGMEVVLTPSPTSFALGSWGWAERSTTTTGLSALKATDARHQVKFRYYQTGSPFEYNMVRFVYTKKRELDIEK